MILALMCSIALGEAPPGPPPTGTPPAAPLDVLRDEGCLACHPVGGGIGPDLAGRVGHVERVLQGGATVELTVDEAYLRRALTDPGVEVLEGFSPGLMPAVTDPARVERLVEAIRALTPEPPASRAWLLAVLAGAVIFVGSHLVLSSAPWRERLLARHGPWAFMGLYSIPVSVGLGLLVFGWIQAPYVALWTLGPWARWVPVLVMPWVMIAQVAGYSTPTPTMAGMADTVDQPPRGIHRITRHPVNVTNAAWALAHLFPNGDLASTGLFLSVAVLGIAGSLHIDRRLARAAPEAWARYAARTSVMPFAAILSGRNTLSLREIGLWRVALGLGLYGAILGGHRWMIGVPVWP